MPQSGLPQIGWREWISLPDLSVPAVKAKVDSGARSSALHTHDYEVYEESGLTMVRFHLHPLKDRENLELSCVAPVKEFREVRDSGGHAERRPFISTKAKIGDWEWEIELSLTNRESMKFRMLLGRSAIAGKFLIESSQSYLAGPVLHKIYDT